MLQILRRYKAQIALSLSTLVVLFCFLGTAEWLARRYGPRFHRHPLSADYIRFLKENALPLFRIKAIGGKPYLVQNDIIWKWEKHQVLPLDKPADVRRILIAGESSADGLGVALAQEIESGPSPKRYEVINCAVGGADLEIIARRFQECMNYSPDAVIFLFGHNLYYCHPIVPPFLLRVVLWTRKSALLSDLGFFEKPRSAYEDAERWRVLETFIDTMAKETRARGIPLMLVTVPSNLWAQPRQSSNRHGDDPAYLETLYDYQTGNRRQAISLLTQASNDHASALWHFTLGTWLYREGAWRKAYAQLILARDLDPARMRASSAVNTVIRASAARDGALLLDAEQIIEEQSPHGIPDWRDFTDCQHVTRRNFFELAHLCALQLEVKGWTGLAGPYRRQPYSPAPLQYQEIADSFYVIPRSDPSGWRTFSYFAQQHLAQLAPQADSLFSRAFPDAKKRAAAFLGLAQALWRAGNRGEARVENEKARRLADGWDAPDMQSGFFDLQEHRRQKALEDFRRALKTEPNDVRALFFIYKLEHKYSS